MLAIREPHEHVADIQVELVPLWHCRQKLAFRSSIGELEAASGILEKKRECTTAMDQSCSKDIDCVDTLHTSNPCVQVAVRVLLYQSVP